MAIAVLAALAAWSTGAQDTTNSAKRTAALQAAGLAPRVAQAERFLARRGWARKGGWAAGRPTPGKGALPAPRPEGGGSAAWQPLGPQAVQSQSYGRVTGRVSALALDPSDATGNRLFVGATGGGVWRSQNAGTSSAASVVFAPLTDNLQAMSNVIDSSISIGAMSVQPGGTNVVLAGTGDPNDALDSYYGSGILRSTDGGNTWSLTQKTADAKWSFTGEGFAGFAWSTVNPQLAVAAVSQAYEGTLVNAAAPNASYEGLYYSTDSGASWSLARITDGPGADVQGPLARFAVPDGNAATAVVWNPVRQLFVAAVRFHGYYQSMDGVTWTRLGAQPGAGLTASMCPTNAGMTGSTGCPIFRGALAVNPLTGDTFAWTVDAFNQDQGLWQDQCGVNAGVCTNLTISFARQWSTAALDSSSGLGRSTVANGDYNLALAAVPSQQDTVLLAGANDLWRCSLAMGCQWRNTTNAGTCMSAQVAGYQHALAWNPANPLEIFVGNDGGLWRSTDAIGETGAVCGIEDATHFQNLNGSLGSLAEVESLSAVGETPYTMMAGLGANGTAGVKGSAPAAGAWPEILGGEGGPVAIDPANSAYWYVNNGAGVSIHRCSQQTVCAPGDFGASPLVNDADVGGDGLTMTSAAPFLVDPLDTSQLLIGTCRVWRGRADGVGWTGANAISPILDGNTGNSFCSGDALIRSMAAMALPGGGELVVVGMYGSLNGGGPLPGHVLAATVNPSSSGAADWQDLTANPVSNDTAGLNAYGFDISSVAIDNHDPTGNTLYVTVAAVKSAAEPAQSVYRTTDGGAHWFQLKSNLPSAPANSVAVDPQDASTVYIATDAGVYFTQQIASCTKASSLCWSMLGTGLPQAPVVQLSASPASAPVHALVAATYGRGIWMTPLLTAGANLTTATATPGSLTFASQVFGTASAAQTVIVTNTGTGALTPGTIAASGDFSETDNCQNQIVGAGGSCAIQVTFTPSQTGSRTGFLTIGANVLGGGLVVALSGTGTPSGVVSLSPASLNFGSVQAGSVSAPLPLTATNSGAVAVSVSSVTVAAPFILSSNACGSSLAGLSACQLTVRFAPTQTGSAGGSLTMVDGAGTQTVALSGQGATAPTDGLSATALSFASTPAGQLSTAQTVTLTNNGDVPLTLIAVTVAGPFQAANNCGTSLAGHASCGIGVVFAPGQAGSQSGTLTVDDALRTQTVSLTGTGLEAPVLAVSPASLSFSQQPVGQASAPLTLTVSNSGGAPAGSVGFQISGLSAANFSVGTTSCGAALASGSSCTVDVTFTPVAAGGATAALVVSSSSTGVTPVSVPLTGTGLAVAGLSVSPAQLVFPVVPPGQSSAVQTVGITNTGNAAANGLTVAVTAPFSLVQNTCLGSLAAGASCSAGVVFSPQVNGGFAGTLTVASASLAAPAVVPLSGTGGAPGSVMAVPSLINFLETGVGLASSPVLVTLTNPSGTSGLSNFAVTATAGYKLVNNSCPGTLAALANCTVGVEFSPVSAGQLTGSLTVTSSALASAPFVTLAGMGFDFAVNPSGAASQAVVNGQTANYKLLITPLNGSQGAFSFKCGTLPPYSACSFNPTSMGVSAHGTGYETVQVATGLPLNTAGAAGNLLWHALPLACGVLLLPLALGRRRRVLLLAALLAIAVGGVSSCTLSGGGLGGGTPRSGPGITPAGSYPVVVTVISNGVAHPVTLTLTVE